MTLNQFINGCTNRAVKSLVLKCKERGDNLTVFCSDDKKVSGQYVTGYGGFTVTRKLG